MLMNEKRFLIEPFGLLQFVVWQQFVTFIDRFDPDKVNC